jgi:hypothetical protein
VVLRGDGVGGGGLGDAAHAGLLLPNGDGRRIREMWDGHDHAPGVRSERKQSWALARVKGAT